MFPRPGPPRMMSTMTIGSSEPAAYDTPSIIRLMPGPEDPVMVLSPAEEVPYSMLMAASSLSACRKVPPHDGKSFAAVSASSLAGVIGYP